MSSDNNKQILISQVKVMPNNQLNDEFANFILGQIPYLKGKPEDIDLSIFNNAIDSYIQKLSFFNRIWDIARIILGMHSIQRISQNLKKCKDINKIINTFVEIDVSSPFMFYSEIARLKEEDPVKQNNLQQSLQDQRKNLSYFYKNWKIFQGENSIQENTEMVFSKRTDNGNSVQGENSIQENKEMDFSKITDQGSEIKTDPSDQFQTLSGSNTPPGKPIQPEEDDSDEHPDHIMI